MELLASTRFPWTFEPIGESVRPSQPGPAPALRALARLRPMDWMRTGTATAPPSLRAEPLHRFNPLQCRSDDLIRRNLAAEFKLQIRTKQRVLVQLGSSAPGNGAGEGSGSHGVQSATRHGKDARELGGTGHRWPGAAGCSRHRDARAPARGAPRRRPSAALVPKAPRRPGPGPRARARLLAGPSPPVRSLPPSAFPA